MKLLSYGLDQRMEPRLAFSLHGQAVDVMRAALWMKENRAARDYLTLASSMKLVLRDWNRSRPLLKNLVEAFQELELSGLSVYDRPVAQPENEIVFFAPVPNPPGLRYFKAFEPDSGFEFGNTQTLLGHAQSIPRPGLTSQGELGAIIGGRGEQLEIAGYCIINNWQDRRIVDNSGLAQGLATSLGPHLVTADELINHKLGRGFNLDMQMRMGPNTVLEGGFKNMQLSFPEMVQQAAATNVQAGDIFCSGSPLAADVRRYETNPGDQVEIEIQALGVLSTPVKPTTARQ